jgi:ABC-type Fe3+ transport system permease subunit
VIAFIVAFVAIDKVNGHQREFSLTDQSLMYTMAQKETVPTWLLVVCAVIAPITILLLWTLLVPPIGSAQRARWRRGELSWREKVWDANLTLLGIGLSIASTITVTNLFKNLVGRPRPGIIFLFPI